MYSTTLSTSRKASANYYCGGGGKVYPLKKWNGPLITVDCLPPHGPLLRSYTLSFFSSPPLHDLLRSSSSRSSSWVLLLSVLFLGLLLSVLFILCRSSSRFSSVLLLSVCSGTPLSCRLWLPPCVLTLAMRR